MQNASIIKMPNNNLIEKWSLSKKWHDKEISMYMCQLI